MASPFSVSIKNKKIKALEELFTEWAGLNDRQIMIVDGEDCPYYYSERTNCGMIGAAAYVTEKFISLEEIPIRRRKRRGQASGGHGRYDIYLFDGTHEYMVEAKQAWKIKDAEGLLDDAEKQLRKIRKEYWLDIPLAMVFVVVGFKQVDDGIIEQHTQELDAIKTCGTVHYYPKETRQIRGGGENAKYIYPGISVLMRVVER
jgi:hypothetical protein